MMTNSKNESILLTSRPVGQPMVANFEFVPIPVPSIADGQVLVKSLYLSVGPSRGKRLSSRVQREPLAWWSTRLRNCMDVG